MGQGVSGCDAVSSAALALTSAQVSGRLPAGGNQASERGSTTSVSSASLVCAFGLRTEVMEGFDEGGHVV